MEQSTTQSSQDDSNYDFTASSFLSPSVPENHVQAKEKVVTSSIQTDQSATEGAANEDTKAKGVYQRGKQSRVCMSGAEKRMICQIKQDHPHWTLNLLIDHLNRDYGLNAKRSAVHHVLKESHYWLSTKSSHLDSRRKDKTSKYPKLEKALVTWYRQQCDYHRTVDANYDITDQELSTKAVELAANQHFREKVNEEFVFNTGWLNRLKRRHGLGKRRRHTADLGITVSPEVEGADWDVNSSLELIGHSGYNNSGSVNSSFLDFNCAPPSMIQQPQSSMPINSQSQIYEAKSHQNQAYQSCGGPKFVDSDDIINQVINNSHYQDQLINSNPQNQQKLIRKSVCSWENCPELVEIEENMIRRHLCQQHLSFYTPFACKLCAILACTEQDIQLHARIKHKTMAHSALTVFMGEHDKELLIESLIQKMINL